MDLRIRPLCLGKVNSIDKSIFTYLLDQGTKMKAPFIMLVIEGGERSSLWIQDRQILRS